MTTNNKEHIVDEIIALDPSLEVKRDAVRELVGRLIESKPNIVIDEAFVSDLRGRLQSTIRTKEAQQTLQTEHTSFMKQIFTSKLALSALVVVFAAVVIFPTLNGSQQDGVMLSMAPQVRDTSSTRAFGSLTSTTEEGDHNLMVAERAETAASFADADGATSDQKTVTSMVAPQAMMMDAGGGTVGYAETSLPADEMSIMPIRWEEKYPIYTYNGTLPTIDEAGYVYRRDTEAISNVSQSVARSFGMGMIDLGSFKSLGIQHVSLVTKGDPAYTISINIEEGSVGINRYWNYNEYDYIDEERAGNAPTQVDGNEMIRIANAFLKKHGIDTASYGAPEIAFDQYTIMPAALEADAMIAYPDMRWPISSVTVRYPLEIDGTPVVGQGGESVGLAVNVNTTRKIVESVWGLQSYSYERSLYPLIQDGEKIIGMIETGGYSNIYYGYYENGSPKTVEIPVGGAEMVLMQYWRYENGRRDEFLIPSLRFDIDQEKWRNEGIYIPNAIMIPLVEDIIKDSVDRPVPMMMDRIPTEPTIGDGAGGPTPPPPDVQTLEAVIEE